MCGNKVGDVESLMYLGSVLQKNVGFEEDMKHKIRFEWIEWRESSSILYFCVTKVISIKLKGKFYKKVARPAMIYGSDMIRLQ